MYYSSGNYEAFARPQKPQGVDEKSAYLIGSGLAALAAACYLVRVEPLEQVIDKLKEEMRTRHILRMRQGQCSIEAGFVWADLLTDLERTSDHCSNIAGCVIDAARHNLNLHETLRAAQTQDPDFAGRFRDYAQTYRLPEGE